MDFCTYEIRSVPDDVCCRLLPPANSSVWYHIGLHLSKVTMFAGLEIVYDGDGKMEKRFTKSKPQITKSSGILDGQDYNGSVVSAAKVKDLVETNPNKHCTRSWDWLIHDRRECNLDSSVKVPSGFVSCGAEVNFVGSPPSIAAVMRPPWMTPSNVCQRQGCQSGSFSMAPTRNLPCPSQRVISRKVRSAGMRAPFKPSSRGSMRRTLRTKGGPSTGKRSMTSMTGHA